MNTAESGEVPIAIQKILVIEDDEEICMLLEDYLIDNGFKVRCILDGAEGLKRALKGGWDIILLDIMLPSMSGIEVLERIRRTSAVPIILLTAMGEESDRVKGLDTGADDYIVKPFSFAELLARIRVVLRRGQSVAPVTILKVADLTLDPVTRIVERSANRIELSAKQFSLLEYLMRHAGQVVSRSMILEKVWDFEFDSLTNVVEVHINRLRNKVDRDYEHPLIHTLRGVGYVLKEKS